MLVHFVCTGNSYRSRLAEAYCNGLQRPELRAVSSGIEAQANENGPISWHAARLLKRHGLTAFMSPHWTQTTGELLAEADVVIFMEPVHHIACCDRFRFSGTSWEIWHVADLDLGGEVLTDGPYAADLAGIAATERTFAQICAYVDRLIERLAARTGRAEDAAAG